MAANLSNPFPGMNPWLESWWGDVHHSLIQYSRDQLAERLPSDLFAQIEETKYVLSPDQERAVYRPDVVLWEDRNKKIASTEVGAAGEGAVAVAVPVRYDLMSDPVTIGHIEIRPARQGGPLVTVIEVMSPANKLQGKRREEYLQKRELYYQSEVNVVELDLLRAGSTPLQLPSYVFDERPELETPYRCCIRRAWSRRPQMEYYPLPLRQRLSRIRIPLRKTDPDVILDLQAPVDEAYLKGRYAGHIDYSKPPVPPLSPDDAAWAAEVVKQRTSPEAAR
jgi:hypothetical protein